MAALKKLIPSSPFRLVRDGEGLVLTNRDSRTRMVMHSGVDGTDCGGSRLQAKPAANGLQQRGSRAHWTLKGPALIVRRSIFGLAPRTSRINYNRRDAQIGGYL